MRTFVAIDLDPEILKNVARLQEILRSQLPKLGWTAPTQMHLTVKFLGEIDDQAVGAVSGALDEAARGLAPPRFEVRGVGTFPPHGRVNVIWVGVRDAGVAMAACHAACETALEGLGLPREQRPFNPHLTLARCRTWVDPAQIRRRLEQHRDFVAGSQTATQLVLYKSTLTSQGAVYEALGEFAFGNA